MSTFFGSSKIRGTFGPVDTNRESENVTDTYPKRKNHYNLVTDKQTIKFKATERKEALENEILKKRELERIRQLYTMRP